MTKKIKQPTDAQLVKLAASVIASRNSIPVLDTGLMLACGINSQLITTDMDNAATVTLDSTIDADGLVIPKTLYAILGVAPVVAIKGGISDVAGNVASDLAMADFPRWGRLMPDKKTSHYTFKVGALLPALEYVRRAVSTEETRYYLCGVYLHETDLPGIGDGVDDGALRMVAADGHRLHSHTFSLADIAEHCWAGGGNTIWPRYSVQLAVSAMKLYGPDAIAELEWSEQTNTIAFRIGRVLIQSKTIDGTFPDYARVIPAMTDKLPTAYDLPADGHDALEASYKIAKTRDDTKIGPKLICDNTGKAEFHVAGWHDAKAGFNGHYMLDAINGATARLLVTDGASPARVEFPFLAGRMAVLMPMRV